VESRDAVALPLRADEGAAAVNDVAAQLAQLRDAGLYRRTRLVSGPQGPRVLVDGRPVVLLCSNNYLGFADHPSVREAAADAAMRWGVGAGASRLVSGTMTIHERLEHRLAEFEGTESCVLFGSGYLANVGVLSTLGRAGQTIFSDALNHASIIDGCRLARAETFVYEHGDTDHLQWALREHGREGDVIVTDSVFSMDGDVAPLAAIVELARRHGARVVVDEAHATGALGPGGRGAVAEAGLEAEVDVLVGTLSKSLGSYGGYVCARRELVELLVNSARALIFSTAPPPPAIAGALAALELLIAHPLRPEKLQSSAAVLRSELAATGIPTPAGRTQIVPLIVGDADAAVSLSEAALARGVFAQAIRPPTVPEGSSRLRLTVMASHTATELAGAVAALSLAARDTGVTFRAAPVAAAPVARAA
jgi:8-amino-7-oxononanoate synthase